MNREEIIKALSEPNKEVLDAHNEILAIQKGDRVLPKTNIEHLDHFLIGGLNNSMVFVGARPSQGKTYFCDQIINNLLNKDINPMNLSVLRINLEMVTKSLLLRDLKKALHKKMRDILSSPYNKEEQKTVTKVINKHRDKRLTNWSYMLDEEGFEILLREYIKKEKKEKGEDVQIICLLDHVHIYPTKTIIDNILGVCNKIKMENSSVSFVIFFQLNRVLEDIWRGGKDSKPNPKNFRPNSSHIYNTDTLMQFADLILTLVIPEVVGLDEYVAVARSYYEYLDDHFVDYDDNVYVRLKGRNRIYYDYIKTRMLDDFDDPKLFCAVLDEEREKRAVGETVKVQKQEKKEEVIMPVFGKDVERPYDGIQPVTDLKLAFGEEGSDDPPF